MQKYFEKKKHITTTTMLNVVFEQREIRITWTAYTVLQYRRIYREKKVNFLKRDLLFFAA